MFVIEMNRAWAWLPTAIYLLFFVPSDLTARHRTHQKALVFCFVKKKETTAASLSQDLEYFNWTSFLTASAPRASSHSQTNVELRDSLKVRARCTRTQMKGEYGKRKLRTTHRVHFRWRQSRTRRKLKSKELDIVARGGAGAVDGRGGDVTVASRCRSRLMLRRHRARLLYKLLLLLLLPLENIKEESSIPEENTDRVAEDEEGADAWTPKVEDKMIKDYLSMVKMQSNELDKLYGVREENNEYLLGKSPISIDGDKVYIGDEPYIKSKGLLELLLKKNPDSKFITNNDMKAYEKILDSTNVHRKRFADDGDLRKCISKKFDNIIEPIFKTGSGLLPPYKVVKRGYGLLPGYKVAKSRDSLTDFVYWNDPNELVDRLRLLVVERSAGNNAHDNEIISIIEELREDGYIY
ncbi:unnamed protein product [Trichogramma brassicae]|uniref:DUF8207 domain-containing protein n=1 Tax=Trichogramma brassicae TaxID=86971 RepID=A0A6H5J246_9HYME|nr:unnamed protein product [Trichogramma brassicae]